MKKLLCIITCSLLGFSVFAQEHEIEHEAHDRHMVAVLLGHSLVLEGVREGERRSIYVPSFALQYNYGLSEKVAIGLHIDALIETFAIENPDGLEIERERPVATILVGAYEFARRFAFLLGGGVEWEKNENYGLVRFGLDYAHPLGDQGFEFISTLNADVLFGGYNTINLAVGVAKTF